MHELKTEIAVSLSAPGEASTAGKVIVEQLSGGSRLVKAFCMGLVGLFVTLLCVAVPLLHLVLVPLGLLMTVMLVISSCKQVECITGGEGVCPYCHKPLTIVRRKMKFPFFERCDSCSRESSIEPEASKAIGI